eukprot:CAMPEP_0194124334 /NCGR_PEP_ID=MMETSP0150-20130528/58176_1 /TAXON_ID=122233 /ORGANISM="Chaetoceros debilis, Strain MM31A-1" /LENGTH=1038 /DNA_ID=CAMNT_0038818009 /DNA_START=128 /DNA_END=3241 /DNA_ORIENTATION=+
MPLKKRKLQDVLETSEAEEQQPTRHHKADRVWTMGISECCNSYQYDEKMKQHQNYIANGKADLFEEYFKKKIEVPSKTSLLQLVTFICNGPVKERREYDHRIDEHLWEIKFAPSGVTIHSDSDDFSEDNEDDGDSVMKVYQICKANECRGMPTFGDEDDDATIVGTNHLVEHLNAIEVGSTVHFLYDYGSTTEVILKVLSVKSVDNATLCNFSSELVESKRSEKKGENEGPSKQLDASEIIHNVHAYHIPTERQIDFFYPTASKIILGEEHSLDYFTLGLCSRIKTESDTIFSTIQGKKQSSFSLIAKLSWENIDQFFTLVEEAFSVQSGPDPQMQDDKRNPGLRSDSQREISRHIFPPTPLGWCQFNKEKEENDLFEERGNSNPFRHYNSRRIFLCKREQEMREATRERITKDGNTFNFAATFPKTASQLTSGKFRWFKYQPILGRLEVGVGRASGIDFDKHHDILFPASQMLRSFDRKFKTLHDLLCEVEASWIVPNNSAMMRNLTSTPSSSPISEPLVMTTDTFLSQHDADLSPSEPLPQEPPTLSERGDAVIISNAKALHPVTSLTIAPQSKTNTSSSIVHVLYSGHKDGSICKWHLETNKMVWKKQVFKDNSESDCDSMTSDFHLVGIRGITVKEDSDGAHSVYAWSHIPDSPNNEPNEIRVLRGSNGEQYNELICEVDGDMNNHPKISCIVFSKLKYDNIWHDSIIVGFFATATTLNYDDNYTNFDLEEAEEVAHGNIMPFLGDETKETWRGHAGIIRSMAVIPDKYLVSCSEHSGHNFAEAIILWGASTPGIPLHRIDLFRKGDNVPGFGHRCKTFHPLNSLEGGIAINRNKILIGGGYGDMIVSLEIRGKDVDGSSCSSNKPTLKMIGHSHLGQRSYEDDYFKGCLVGSGNTAIISNEGCEEAWLFQMDCVGDHPFLDTDMSRRDSNGIEKLGRFEEDDKYKFKRAQSIASGKLLFSYQKVGLDNRAEGGPIALAIKGRYVVAGFQNGSIVKSSLLPVEYVDESCGSSNMHASSFLHSDSSDPHHFEDFG